MGERWRGKIGQRWYFLFKSITDGDGVYQVGKEVSLSTDTKFLTRSRVPMSYKSVANTLILYHELD